MRYSAVLALLFSAALSAQTVERTMHPAGFGWGPLDIPISVETDGDFATREWLVRSQETGLYRVVAERGAGICAGVWFNPTPEPFMNVQIQRVGAVHKLVVQSFGTSTVTLVALHTPGC